MPETVEKPQKAPAKETLTKKEIATLIVLVRQLKYSVDEIDQVKMLIAKMQRMMQDAK